MEKQGSRTTVNHEQIRTWVEERGGWPATVKGTGSGDEPGILRIDYPNYSGGETLKRISWEAFFQKFEEEKLAFLYQEKLSSGETSRFSKLISREDADLNESDTKTEAKRPSSSTMTKAEKPPMETTEETKQKHLNIAKGQGVALKQAVNEMTKQVAHGEEEPAGHMIIGYAVEKAEGMYKMQNGKLQWTKPQDGENAHIEVVARDGADGRFIPGLTVHVTVIDSQGKELGTHRQPFLWHPWLYHYGRNWQLPGEGEYTLRIHIEAPEFARHDEKNGKRYLEPVQVTFEGVKIETGQK